LTIIISYYVFLVFSEVRQFLSQATNENCVKRQKGKTRNRK